MGGHFICITHNIKIARHKKNIAFNILPVNDATIDNTNDAHKSPSPKDCTYFFIVFPFFVRCRIKLYLYIAFIDYELPFSFKGTRCIAGYL